MDAGNDVALRTRIYVDGFNLYYACLKGTPYKWLDLRALAQGVLATILFEQKGTAVQYRFSSPAIHYFTAPIQPDFAKAEDSVLCQFQYLSGLRAHLGDALRIIEGYHDAKPARAFARVEGKPARECNKLEIWKVEEKQSDVALAVHAYSDAIRGEVDQVVVVTNDSDFVPAMRMIREHTDVVVGLIVPAKQGTVRCAEIPATSAASAKGLC